MRTAPSILAYARREDLCLEICPVVWVRLLGHLHDGSMAEVERKSVADRGETHYKVFGLLLVVLKIINEMAELLSFLPPLFELVHDHSMGSVLVGLTGLGNGDLIGEVINNHIERFEEAVVLHKDQVELRGQKFTIGLPRCQLGVAGVLEVVEHILVGHASLKQVRDRLGVHVLLDEVDDDALLVQERIFIILDLQGRSFARIIEC